MLMVVAWDDRKCCILSRNKKCKNVGKGSGSDRTTPSLWFFVLYISVVQCYRPGKKHPTERDRNTWFMPQASRDLSQSANSVEVRSSVECTS